MKNKTFFRIQLRKVYLNIYLQREQGIALRSSSAFVRGTDTLRYEEIRHRNYHTLETTGTPCNDEDHEELTGTTALCPHGDNELPAHELCAHGDTTYDDDNGDATLIGEATAE